MKESSLQQFVCNEKLYYNRERNNEKPQETKMTPSSAELFESYKKLLLSVKVLNKKIFFVLLLFAISTAMGFYTAQSNPEWTKEIVNILAENFVGLKGKSNSELWLDIFFNNVSVSAMIIALFFLFGFAPIAALLSNGTMIGVVVAYSIEKIGGDSVFLALIPHGLFEIPAFLIAAALSIHLSGKFLDYIRKVRKTFKKELVFAIRIFFLVIVPLLFIAAIIETFLTPILVF